MIILSYSYNIVVQIIIWGSQQSREKYLWGYDAGIVAATPQRIALQRPRMINAKAWAPNEIEVTLTSKVQT